jgi:hypothetical protein
MSLAKLRLDQYKSQLIKFDSLEEAELFSQENPGVLAVFEGDDNPGGGITNETDPIFVASPAYGITGLDISKWNNSVTLDTVQEITANKTFSGDLIKFGFNNTITDIVNNGSNGSNITFRVNTVHGQFGSSRGQTSISSTQPGTSDLLPIHIHALGVYGPATTDDRPFTLSPNPGKIIVGTAQEKANWNTAFG